MAKKTKQAYKQAPWRRQLQSAGFSLVLVIAILAVLSIYLIISAQAASAGLEIMDMHYEEEEIMRIIANERTELAWKTSYTEMQKRAEKAGYQVPPAANGHFMTIPVTRVRILTSGSPPAARHARAVFQRIYQQSCVLVYGTS
jgi:hypothetical protein